MASDSPVDPSINPKVVDLVKKLEEFGNALLHPPASNKELLARLEVRLFSCLGLPYYEFDLCLSWISQEPEERVKLSLGPSAKALIANQLLRHADADVQIAVLCGINEITRITAPDWPYEEKEMKEFFLLLVQSLGRLSLMHNHCYAKVVSVLYTIARIRSCLIMVELQMDGPIMEMFGHFLSSIQSRSSDDLFSDMVKIMTMIVEDYSEEGCVPVDLLSILLTSVKKDKKEASPTSWALGEQILQESAKHVGPCLAKVVQSLEIDVKDYADIVASICRREAQKEVQVENMMDREHASDSSGSKKIDKLLDEAPRSMENNSTAQDMDNGMTSEQKSLKTLHFSNQIIVSTLSDHAISKRDDSGLKDESNLKALNAGPIEVQRATDLKTISEAANTTVMVHAHDVQGMDLHISSEQNASKTLQFGNQTTQSPLSDNAASRSDVSSLKNENFLKEQTSGAIEVQKAVDLETISEAENVFATEAVSHQENDIVKVGKKRERKPNSLFKLEEGYDFTGLTDETVYPKLSFGRKNYKGKHNHLSDGKSGTRKRIFLNKNFCRKGTAKKKGCTTSEDAPEQKQVSLPSQVVHAKRSSSETAIPANCDEESAQETLSRFEVLAYHLTNKEAPDSQHEMNLSSSKGEASRMTYGEKLVSCKIKVWWPLDQEYYEGFVDSFELSTMKHKIIYDDGDEETLNLLGEDWQLVKGAMLLDGQERVQGSSASSDLKLKSSTHLCGNPSAGPSSKKMKNDNGGASEVAGPSPEQV